MTRFYIIPHIFLKGALTTNKNGHVIPDILLNGALSTNKTGDQFIHYTWHIVESGVKHQ
jgi:hypothetical protein